MEWITEVRIREHRIHFLYSSLFGTFESTSYNNGTTGSNSSNAQRMEEGAEVMEEGRGVGDRWVVGGEDVVGSGEGGVGREKVVDGEASFRIRVFILVWGRG